MSGGHESVLQEETLESLAIAPDDVVVDATVGGAGHFGAILKKLGPKGTLIGIDADRDASLRAQQVVSEVSDSDRPDVELITDNFRNLKEIFDKRQIKEIDKFLFDLGWSGYQLSNGRGFSFQTDEPLLMTYGDSREGTSVAELVNSATEENLANILYEFGEEKFSRGIAKAIVLMRQKERILTTNQLVAAIKNGTPEWYQKRRLHPATKTFQALRIYVNDEFGALREGLIAALARLAPSGRIAVITFHSSEDRIVKTMFREAVNERIGTLLTKKPIIPTRRELSQNPRSRSAKLRVFIKSES